MAKFWFQLKILFKRLGLILLAYTLLRIIFFSYYSHLFSGSFIEIFFDFIYGLRFDLAAIVLSNSVFILLHFSPVLFFNKYYQAVLKVIFFLANIPCLMLNCIDLAYFRFTLKRITFDFIETLKLGNDAMNLLPQFLKDFWMVVLFFILLLILMEFGYRKIKIKSIEPNKRFILLQLCIIILLIGGFIIAARGGLQYRPLSVLNAAEFSRPSNAPLILNSAFTFINTIGDKGLEENKYMSQVMAEKIYPVRHINNNGLTKKTNVVLIILEGIGKEYIGKLNNKQGYTPFIDSLIDKSLVFANGFANGKRSIEGIPAITAGIPSLMNNAYITSSYASNQINSLASILNEQGFHTSFFHGGNNGTMGFDIFTKQAGFKEYHGRNEYGNDKDYDGKWGIFDEEFYQYFVSKLSLIPPPFFSCFFSLSSHHPFTIPAKHKNRFRKGTLEIHESVMYADYSLKKFFQSAEKTDWYKNTLFVITSDHTALSEHPFYQSPLGIYTVPFIFFHPSDSSLKGVSKVVIQQTDLMPTILNYLNVPSPYFAFGQNVFDANAKHIAVNFLSNTYQLIQDKYLLQFDGKISTGFYNYTQDSTLRNNLAGNLSEEQKSMETTLKAILQSYNHHLIHNTTR